MENKVRYDCMTLQRKRGDEGAKGAGGGVGGKEGSLPPEELEARRRREAAKARVEKRTLAAFGMG